MGGTFAVTVVEMAQIVGQSELSKQLTEVAARYIEHVQKQLPKGVEIARHQEATAHA